MLNIIIRLLGGVPANAHENLKITVEFQKKQLKVYKNFATEINLYCGCSNAFKAQQEFRQLMLEVGRPVRRNEPFNLLKETTIDNYLGRIVDNCRQLSETVLFHDFKGKEHYEDAERLKSACGEEYLAPTRDDR